MDSEPDRELEVIREQMNQTRSNLAEKIGALETQVADTVAGVTGAVEAVKGTVANVTEAVTGTVANVSDTVTETVKNVSHTLDLSARVQEAPWTAVGVAVAAGMVGGYLLTSPKAPYGGVPPASSGYAPQETPRHAAPSYSASYAPEPSRMASSGGMMSGAMGEAFHTVLSSVTGMGVTTVMGVLANLAQNHLPDFMQKDAQELMTDLTRKLGGRPLSADEMASLQSTGAK